MSIELFRIDERLIHGQVVIGWGHHFRPARYVIVDAELSESEWEQDLYRLGAGGAEVLFEDVPDALEHLSSWLADDVRTILLTRDVGTMTRLAERGDLAGQAVNLGGIHHGPGRKEVLTYLHLTGQDVTDLKALEAAGVTVTARDLPDAPRVQLAQLTGA